MPLDHRKRHASCLIIRAPEHRAAAVAHHVVMSKSSLKLKDLSLSVLSEEMERDIEKLVEAVHDAREREAEWSNSDTQQKPSEIKLKEEELRAAKTERQRLEAELERRRGDIYPEPETAAATALNMPSVPLPSRQISKGMKRGAREDALSPLIRRAQANCNNPADVNEVWSALCRLADDEVAPLLASTRDGVKYRKNGSEAYFKKGALRNRLNRLK